jgi:hypothetical protein
MNAISQQHRDSITEARRQIRRGITNAEIVKLSLELQDDIAEEHRVELAIVERTGRCSGNCTSDCLTMNHRNETVCRWTYRACAVNEELAQIIELFSTINERNFQACQLQSQP